MRQRRPRKSARAQSSCTTGRRMGLFTKTPATPDDVSTAAPVKAPPPAPSPITAAESQLIAPTPGTTIVPRNIIAPSAPRTSPVQSQQVSSERQVYFQQ